MKKLTIIAFFMALFANMTFAAEVNVFSALCVDCKLISAAMSTSFGTTSELITCILYNRPGDV